MIITQDDTNSSLKRYGGDITIEAWIKPASTSSNANPDQIYFPQLANGTLALVDNNTMIFTWYNNDQVNWPGSMWNNVYDITPIPVGRWTHIALTVANSDTQGEYTFYVNGKSSTRHYYAKLPCANAGDHAIGGYTSPLFYRCYEGQIDEMRISSINRMNPSGISESKWYQPHDGTDTYSVLLYHFDETTGTTATDSRGSNDGIVNGHTFDVYSSTDTVHPAFNRSLFFDGQQGQTVVAMDDASLDLTDKFTVEAWIKPTQFGDGMRNIVYKVDDSGNGWPPYSMGLWGSALWCQFVTANSAVTKSATIQGVIAPNRWQHVAMTFDKGKPVPGGGRPMIKIIINGREIAPEQYAFQLAPNTLGPNLTDGPVLIGMWDFNVTPYVGWIDDVRISNIAMDFNPVGADVEIIDLDKTGDDLDITFTSALYGIYTIKSGTNLNDMANWPVVGGVTGDLMNTTYSIVDAFLTANPQQFYRVEEFAAVEQGYPIVADKAITVDADLSDWAAGDIVADRENFFALRDGRALPYEDIEVYVAYSDVDNAFYIGWQTEDVDANELFQIMFSLPGSNKNVQVAVDAHDATNDLLFYSTSGGVGWTPDLKLNGSSDTYTEADLAVDGGAFTQTTSGGVWTGEIKLPYSVIDVGYTFAVSDQRTVWFNRYRGTGDQQGTTHPGGWFWEWEHSTLHPAGVGVQR